MAVKDDSGDDNDLTASFLSTTGDDDDDCSSNLAALDPNCRSPMRIFLSTILLTIHVVIPLDTYQQVCSNKVEFAVLESAAVMTIGTIVLRSVYLHVTHFYMPKVQKYALRFT